MPHPHRYLAMLNVSFLVGTYMMVSPCSEVSEICCSLASGLSGGFTVSDEPLILLS